MNGSSLEECVYYGVSFLGRIGYFDKSDRFWTEKTFKDSDSVCTYKNIKDKSNSIYWRTTAAWKAIVGNGKVKCWQVFYDYNQLQAIIDKNQAV